MYCSAGSVTVAGWLGHEGAGDPYRRGVLLAFGVIFFFRMVLTGLFLLRRKFGWDEYWPVLIATAIYQIGFATLGTASSAPIGGWDMVGIGLYIIGCYLNTGSEWQRKRFKDNPANTGKIYTLGLFRWVRHVNYLGDMLWVIGWAILSASLWSSLIPVLLLACFVFYLIPILSRHLQTKYGQSYEQWKAHSWALIPFVY